MTARKTPTPAVEMTPELARAVAAWRAVPLALRLHVRTCVQKHGHKQLTFVAERGGKDAAKSDPLLRRVLRSADAYAAFDLLLMAAAKTPPRVVPKRLPPPLRAEDIDVAYYRFPGQGVNEAARAVRATYRPTGVSAYADGHRSRVANKAEAIRLLREHVRHAATHGDAGARGKGVSARKRKAVRR